jgi:hypothetical protein
MEQYIAGFFDGEGYIGLATGYPCIIIAQKYDKDILCEMRDYLNIGSVYTRGKNQLNTYQWKIHRTEEIEKFILKILPFIRVKKKECEWMSANIHYWVGFNRWNITEEIKNKRIDLRKEEVKKFRTK